MPTPNRSAKLQVGLAAQSCSEISQRKKTPLLKFQGFPADKEIWAQSSSPSFWNGVPMLTLIARIHNTLEARRNCLKHENHEWVSRHEETLSGYNSELPSGSGFDLGCAIDIDRSTSKAIYINTSYHHMNQDGFYTCWTDHVIKVVPEFSGFDFKISGPNRNSIKEYIEDVFYADLSEEN